MDSVEITVPVTPAAAERWREPAERARLGALLSLAFIGDTADAEIADAVRLLGTPEADRREGLMRALTAIRGEARRADLTPDEIDSELSTWKRERAGPRRP